jgi:hypothetical protein
MDEAGATNKVDSTVGLVWPLLAGTLGVPGLFSNGVEINDRVRGLALTSSPSIVIDQTASTGISFWFWIKVVSYGTIGMFCALDTFGTSDNSLELFFQSIDGSTTTVDLSHQKDNFNFVDVTTPNLSWTLGSWHMIAGTYDKTAHTINIYVDGILSVTTPDILVYPDLTNSFWSLKTPNPIGTVPDFICDELGLCLNGALTPAQITALWNGGSGVTWPAVNTIVPYP